MAAVEGEQGEGQVVGGEDRRLEAAHRSGPQRPDIKTTRLLLPLGAMLVGYLVMPLTRPSPGHTAAFLLLFFAIFACYALVVTWALGPASSTASSASARRAVWIVLLAALLFRLPFLAASPALSDDIERYLWDGRLVMAGRNPYLEPPGSEALAPFRGARYKALAHRDVRTIYPPAAQLLFAAGAFAGGGDRALRLLLIMADLSAAAVLAGLLARRGQPPLRSLIYAWNPLAVIEVAWSGHLEPAGVLFVLAAAAAIISKRRAAAGAALAVAGLVKLLPFALFAPLLREMRGRALALAALLVAVACWPFRSAGWRLFEGLATYAGRWEANPSLFSLARVAITWLDPTPALKGAIAVLQARLPGGQGLQALYPYLYPETLARVLCAATALLVAGILVRRGTEPLRGIYLFTGALLLLSPTLHPWYLLWILPWACLFASPAWILLTGLMALSYVNLGAPGAAAPCPWVGLVIYPPFYLLLARAAWTARTAARLDGPAAPGISSASGSGW